MMFWSTLTHQQSAALQNCTHSMLRCLAHLTQTTISDNVNKSTDWCTCQTNRKAQHNPTNSTMLSPLHLTVYPPSSALIICMIKIAVQTCGRLSQFQYPCLLQIQNILIALTSLVSSSEFQSSPHNYAMSDRQKFREISVSMFGIFPLYLSCKLYFEGCILSLFLQVPQLTGGLPVYVNKYEMHIKYTQFSPPPSLSLSLSLPPSLPPSHTHTHTHTETKSMHEHRC
jgi:hypothetical protein